MSGRIAINRKRASSSLSGPAQSAALMPRRFSHAAPPVTESYTGGGALCPKCKTAGEQTPVSAIWDGMSQAQPTSGLRLGPSLQIVSDETEADKHSPDGLLMSLAGSGTCQIRHAGCSG